MKEKLNTWTVKQLKEQLEKFDESTPVVFAYPSHDYWQTELAGNIRDIDKVDIEYSNYHNQFQICKEDSEQEEDSQSVVVLLI